MTRIVQTESEWDEISPAWEALWEDSSSASTTTHFVWLRTWWRVYQASVRGELRIVTVWRGAELIAALPLYLQDHRTGPLRLRVLRFISTGEAEFEEVCADYLNLLYKRPDEAICVAAVWKAIEQLRWDNLELLDLPADSPILRTPSNFVEIGQSSRGECPVADLTGGFEGYLKLLSSNSRQQARRLLREGDEAGITFVRISSDQVDEAFTNLVRLHQARWESDGKPGVFAAPRFVAFHRALIAAWLPTNAAALACLYLNSEPIAVLYGFISGNRFEFYQSGVHVTADVRLRSPGNLAHLLLMRSLGELGITEYDFLRGSSSYKERLATKSRELRALTAWRPTSRSIVYRSSRAVVRVIRRVLKGE